MAKRNPPRHSGYIGDNQQWKEFCEKLHHHGVGTRWMWEARTRPELDFPNVHCVAFYGSGFQPHVLTAIIVDYNAGAGPTEENGFGLFMDRDNRTMTEEAAFIAGPKAKNVKPAA